MPNTPLAHHDLDVTDRVEKLFQDAMTLSEDERLDLADLLLASIQVDEDWLQELQRRALCAADAPEGALPAHEARP